MAVPSYAFTQFCDYIICQAMLWVLWFPKVYIIFMQVGRLWITSHPQLYTTFYWLCWQVLNIRQVTFVCNHCLIHSLVFPWVVTIFECFFCHCNYRSYLVQLIISTFMSWFTGSIWHMEVLCKFFIPAYWHCSFNSIITKKHVFVPIHFVLWERVYAHDDVDPK